MPCGPRCLCVQCRGLREGTVLAPGMVFPVKSARTLKKRNARLRLSALGLFVFLCFGNPYSVTDGCQMGWLGVWCYRRHLNICKIFYKLQKNLCCHPSHPPPFTFMGKETWPLNGYSDQNWWYLLRTKRKIRVPF